MGYLFYKGKQYADEILIDTTLDSDSTHAIANNAVSAALDSLEASMLPECNRTTAGTYVLRCVVDANGNKTYSWVAAE